MNTMRLPLKKDRPGDQGGSSVQCAQSVHCAQCLLCSVCALCLGCTLCSVSAVLSMCCDQCVRCAQSVHCAQGMCCAQCLLCSGYSQLRCSNTNGETLSGLINVSFHHTKSANPILNLFCSIVYILPSPTKG